MSNKDILKEINAFISRHTFFELSIDKLSGGLLTITGSDDFSYYYSLKIEFKNVFSIIGNMSWRSDTQCDFISILDGQIAKDINIKYKVEFGNYIFKLNNEDGIDTYIIAESIDFSTDVFKFYH